MIHEPMSRRLVVTFAAIGVVLAVAGLIARPVNISVAVVLFLIALGSLGLAGYGVLDRLLARRQQTKTQN
ncbi:hypothetical protein [Kribbella sp. NPDC048928]|uniref:hypothetical protein n=1 Tax=Kribbella sp. NPDC048928 TaxID=3364111 RepID=UPI0037185A65